MCGCLHQGGLGLSGPIDHAGRAMLRNHVRARDNGQWPATAAAQCPAGVCHMHCCCMVLGPGDISPKPGPVVSNILEELGDGVPGLQYAASY